MCAFLVSCPIRTRIDFDESLLSVGVCTSPVGLKLRICLADTRGCSHLTCDLAQGLALIEKLARVIRLDHEVMTR